MIFKVLLEADELRRKLLDLQQRIIELLDDVDVEIQLSGSVTPEPAFLKGLGHPEHIKKLKFEKLKPIDANAPKLIVTRASEKRRLIVVIANGAYRMIADAAAESAEDEYWCSRTFCEERTEEVALEVIEHHWDSGESSFWASYKYSD